MKKVGILLYVLITSLRLLSQEENSVRPGSKLEQQLENLAELEEVETEDDSFLQSLNQFKRTPININTASASELKELRFLNPIQIESLIKYRSLLGYLINIYELQAVPGFDLETIQQIITYVTVGNPVPFSTDLKTRFSKGLHSILTRTRQLLEKSEGFIRPDSNVNRYPGSRQHLFLRYKYVYRNLFQYGVVAEKDAGETFFKGRQKLGFDFYSFHLFARKLGRVKLLAIGDFTVNLGQGLIHWQSLAFKKSADIVAIKRQAEILRPYNSAGEFNFMRGIGGTITINKRIDVTAFASYRNQDATVKSDTLQTNEDFISSILTTGYHRTSNENSKKNSISQTAIGGNVSYNNKSLHLGINSVGFVFSSPLQKDIEPYNQYAIRGKNWYNYSIDYSYTFRNLHLFGEAAMDKNGSKALVSGILASLDQRVDASLVYRNIGTKYQTLYGNAFTEGTLPTNESGFFAGISVKPVTQIRIDAYADVFSFPWLRYRVDAPSQGTEYFVQLNYKPNKQVEVYTRYRNENKPGNLSGLATATRPVVNRPRQDWRTQVLLKASRTITLRSRMQLLWFNPSETLNRQEGFLTYVDVAFKNLGSPLAFNSRLQYFETEGFDSRIYAYESDVLYSFSVPQFIGKGMRYYINVNYDLNKKTTFWFRWSQTIYKNQNSIGSGLDEIIGNKRSEIKLQLMYNFR